MTAPETNGSTPGRLTPHIDPAWDRAALARQLERDLGPAIRTFESGATRDTEAHKPDHEGYWSPLVIARYGQYMLKHQEQPDGSWRESDNWQKGMPRAVYMKSMWRHFLDVWTRHRNTKPVQNDSAHAEALCALLFNVQGYLDSLLRADDA